MEALIVNNSIMKALKMDKIQLLFNKDHLLFIIGKWLMQKLKKMVPIDLYTGLRKKINKKMALLKEKYGKKLKDILVIGEIIVKKDSVYSSIQMEINMKECGPWIENMAKELIGVMKEAN
jgi:hypothetical protein